MLQVGVVTKSYGRQFIVEVDKIKYSAVTRGKKTDYVVGDKVRVELINSEQLQIIELIPRTNLIYRMDHNRSKLIASNVSQIMIIVAVEPNCNINFLNSCLLFAESLQIKPYVVVNKSDLAKSTEFIQEINNLYRDGLGYSVIGLSAISDCSSLTTLLKGQQTLLIGQSGVGKSSITNRIIPGANAAVDDITKAGTSGRHTTTHATLYYIDEVSSLVDCPGLQEFGLYHLDLLVLPELFPELRPYLNKCRFRNCRHVNEPDCAIIAAYEDLQINKIRFDLFQSLTEKLIQKTRY